jgi:hypothetical protein
VVPYLELGPSVNRNGAIGVNRRAEGAAGDFDAVIRKVKVRCCPATLSRKSSSAAARDSRCTSTLSVRLRAIDNIAVRA